MMKFIAFVFLLLLQTLIADDAALSISVPKSISPCSPANMDINGGTPPYSVSIMKTDDPSGSALQEFTDVRQPSSLSWSPNLAKDAVITFHVKDSNGATAISGQSSVSASCAQNLTASGPSPTNSKVDDVTPPQSINSTASNTSNNGVPNLIPPTDGSTPTNGTPPLAAPIAATNGSANSPDVNMGSITSVNSTGTNTSISTPVADATTTLNSPKNTTQSRSSNSNSNSNNSKNNQTAKPSSSNRASSTSTLSPLKSIHSILFTPFIVILVALI